MNMALEPSFLNPEASPPAEECELRGSKETGSAWNAINWKQVERVVFKLQKRIYQASQRENVKAVRRLQRFLQGSWSARLLATLNLQAPTPAGLNFSATCPQQGVCRKIQRGVWPEGSNKTGDPRQSREADSQG